jgi:hypothetical protein
MNNRIAIAIITGVVFFFISLMTIKNTIYYYNTEVIPKVVYNSDINTYKIKINSLKKEYGTNVKYNTDYGDTLNTLRLYRKQKTYNYIIAIILSIGGFGIGYLGAGLKANKNKL